MTEAGIVLQVPRARVGLSRRPVIVGGALALVGGLVLPARAQGPERPSEKHLRAWIAYALGGTQAAGNFPDGPARAVGFARAQKLIAAIATFNDIRFGLAVILPEQENGLIFYELHLPSRLFKIHRTGVHLRRLASARNNSANEWLTWAGADCDAHYAKLLAYWAKEKVPEPQR